MGSLDQSKRMVSLLTEHHRSLLKSSATELGKETTERSPEVHREHNFDIKFSALVHLAFVRHVTPKGSFLLVRARHPRGVSGAHFGCRAYPTLPQRIYTELRRCRTRDSMKRVTTMLKAIV